MMKGPFSSRVMLVILAVVIGFTATILVLARSSPAWFDLPERDDQDAAALGEQVEFRLAEEFQLIRPEDQTWRLRIRDRDVNAWLATRLIPWLQHERNVKWPEDWSRPQVRFSPAGIRIASRMRGGWASDRVLSIGVRPELRDGALRLTPGFIQLGRMPVPFAQTRMDDVLRQSIDRAEGGLQPLLDVAMGQDALEAVIPLVD